MFIHRILFYSLMFFGAALSGPVFSAEVSDTVYKELMQRSEVRVVVSFRVEQAAIPMDATWRMSTSGRQLIADARSRIFDELPKGHYRAGKAAGSLTVMALEVDATALDALAAAADVLRIDLDAGGHHHLTESLPLSGFDIAHAEGYSGVGRRVAVLDSGIDTDHADFNSAIIDQYCYCQSGDGSNCCPNGQIEQSGPGSAEDDNGHGTNVSGIVLAEGAVSDAGGAYGGELVAVKVLGADGSFYSAYNIAVAMEWVAANHPEVDALNLSLGSFDLFTALCDNIYTWTQAYSQAVANLRANGTVVTVSAGNDASGTEMSAPACIEDAMATGAVYDFSGPFSSSTCNDPAAAPDEPACFSNSNVHTDLFAPGSRITSSALGGGLETYSGTSQAAPHVAACALLLRNRNPALGTGQVEELLVISPTQVTDPTNDLTFPRLDCYHAMLQTSITCEAGPRTLSGPVTYTGMETHRSTTTLATSGAVTIGNGAAITFDAASGITLDYGFRVQAGGRFVGRIGPVGC